MESGIQRPGSGIQRLGSGIQDLRGFSYMGRDHAADHQPRNGFSKYPLAREGSGHLTPSTLRPDPPHKGANHCLYRQPINAIADSRWQNLNLVSSDCCPPWLVDILNPLRGRWSYRSLRLQNRRLYTDIVSSMG